MRTLLIAGGFHNLLREYGLDIVNRETLVLDEAVTFLQHTQLMFDQILITDDGLAGNDAYSVRNALTNVVLQLEREYKKQPVLLITGNAMFQDFNVPGVQMAAHYVARIPIAHYIAGVMGSQEENKGGFFRARKPSSARETVDEKPGDTTPKEETVKKTSFVDRLKKSRAPAIASTTLEREFDSISREISRVVAISGCRGSGVTSTAVNLAQMANNKNISTVLIDLDIVNCALNLYFNEFYELAEAQEDIACSLIRNLAKPQNYYANSFRVRNLHVITLAYAFRDRDLLERFFTSAKLVNMLSVFRKHFQLCLLDMPMEVMGQLKESMLYIDSFGLCVPNNLYALTGTLRMVQNIFDPEEQELLYSKAKIIVTKYNEQASIKDEIFSPEKVCQLLFELNDDFSFRGFDFAGHVPYNVGFDMQLETDIPIVNQNAYMEKAYGDILLRLIKGAKQV